MGIKPQVDVKFLDDSMPATIDRLRTLETTRQEVQKLLEQHQQEKDFKKLMEMKVEEQVWLENQNLPAIGSQKLQPRQYDPFMIKEHVGQVAYRLDLPDMMKIHNVFHIDLLLPYKETEAYGTPFTRPPPVIDHGEEEYKFESIIKSRRKGRECKLQYLVHWKGYPNADDLWVDEKHLHAPELLQEFKFNSTAAGRMNV